MEPCVTKKHTGSVYAISDNIVGSLGFSTAENVRNIRNGRSGIDYVNVGRFSDRVLPFALTDDTELNERADATSIPRRFTRLEQMMLLSVNDALTGSGIDVTAGRCVFVISTTKGNIDELSTNNPSNLQPMLWEAGERIRRYYGNPVPAVVVSNACISGVLAVETAARMLRGGLYDHAVVTGGDIVSRFVVSGFESLRALSNNHCRPYDAARDGLTLGEGCATIVLGCRPDPKKTENSIIVSGGASTNDAVHISAPDRTGTGLSLAIEQALEHSGIGAADIDAVCAHGTATLYNDEMESQTFRTVGLSNTPVYGLKGYWGHTLGAAGLMEIVTAIQSLKQQLLFRTLGFESLGTSEPLNIVTETRNAPLRRILKTASGFGGCNAALVLGIVDETVADRKTT